MVIIGILLSLFLSALESTVVATAMPTIVSSLGGVSIYSWVFSGYLLSSTVTMPLWGRLSDLHGRRPLFLIGVFIFMLGSAFCGMSQSMRQLIFFRFLQGLGAGAVMPLTFTIIGHIFSLEQRAKMQGFFSGVWGVASVIGPLVGGTLADHLSWRWVFYINIPFSLLSMFLIYRGLEEEKLNSTQNGSLDLIGTLTFACAILCLLGGLSIFSRYGWVGTILFLLSGLLIFLYIRTENRAEHPILPLKLFKIRIFSAAQSAGLFSGMAMFGTLSFIPLYMQSVLGATATEAGRILLPFMLSWVVFSILGSRLLLKFGYRGLVLTGNALLVCGFALMAFHQGRIPVFLMAVSMVLEGAGMGFNMAPFLIAVQNAVPKNLMGAATSSTQFVRTVGGAIGVSIMGTALSRYLQVQSRLLLQDPSIQTQVVGKILEHPDQIIHPQMNISLSPELLLQAQTHMAAGLKNVFILGMVFSVLSFLACLNVPKGSAHSHVWKT